MRWTLKALTGLVFILTLWLAGWGVIALALTEMSRNWPAGLPDSAWLHGAALVAPALAYFFAGPFTLVLYLRWIRQKVAEEHVQRTRERIARQRLPKTGGN
jgi:hypothetical protein